ncbi:unnamed protein product [Adineta steineri]|uniref:Uncharacterized protein n=1 Tax=Adineta steineri TaxID=433720 RepID=A0A820A9W0_9BILA|nr:unnamed protein product [Adineta steineri]
MIDDLSKINFISVITDFYSDLKGISYLVLTGHYLTTDFVLSSTVLRFSSFQTRHFSHLIGLEIEKQLTELNLFDKVTSITCDAAPNMIKTLDYLTRADISRIRCQAHLLHLIICNVVTEERLSQSLQKVNIVGVNAITTDQGASSSDYIGSQVESQEVDNQQKIDIDSYNTQRSTDDDFNSTNSKSEDENSLTTYEDNFQIGVTQADK